MARSSLSDLNQSGRGGRSGKHAAAEAGGLCPGPRVQRVGSRCGRPWREARWGVFISFQPSVSVQREVGAWMPAKGSPHCGHGWVPGVCSSPMFIETSLDAWHFCRHLMALLKLTDPVRSITQLECLGCFSLLGTEGKSHRSSCVWMEQSPPETL